MNSIYLIIFHYKTSILNILAGFTGNRGYGDRYGGYHNGYNGGYYHDGHRGGYTEGGSGGYGR